MRGLWQVTGARLLALSFDDGPADVTPGILDLLKTYNANATFFLLGQEIATREQVVKRIAHEGHELGNHTFSHRQVNTLTQTELEQELHSTSSLIEQVSGLKPRLFRPPHGFSGLVAFPVAQRLGLTTVRWTAIVTDWSGAAPEQIADDALAAATPGAVIVLHDGGGDRRPTLEALERIVPELVARGYTLVTVSDLLQVSRSTRRQVVVQPRSPAWRFFGKVRRMIRHRPARLRRSRPK
jgi:peptidoglycan/xylan/chitin deacetylase (PgdA/CDA1 family)